MSLTERINEDIKKAMLAKEKRVLEALRAVKSALLLEKTSMSKDKSEISPETEIRILQKLVKQRRDAGELYHSQNRNDLSEEELFQAGVIEKYLPEQLSDEELRKVIADIMSDLHAVTMKDMGRVMGVASQKLSGKADNKSISVIVKELLSGKEQ